LARVSVIQRSRMSLEELSRDVITYAYNHWF
jgi:hypothetical protein